MDNVVANAVPQRGGIRMDASPAPAIAERPVRSVQRFGDLLVSTGHFTRGEIERHAAEARVTGHPLGEYLIGKRLLSRAIMYDVLSGLHSRIPIKSVNELPEWDVVLNDAGMPLGDSETPRGSLILAVSADVSAGDRRAFVLASAAGIASHSFVSIFARMTHLNYAPRAVLLAEDASILDVVLSVWKQRRSSNNDTDPEQSSVLHAEWDSVIREARRLGASDIHLSGSSGRGEFRFRIHGELEHHSAITEAHAISLAASMYNTMVDEGSTSGGFNPRETQDAVVTRSYPEGTLRLRYSGLPVEPAGVNVTLRLIPIGVTIKPKSPAELGYAPDQCDLLERIFARSSGLILFLGTTGSGKSTSMANLLMQLVKDRPGKQLRTVEEPVEIRIPGSNVSQTSVVRSKDDNGNAFVDVMRALMRSDPDYLMVGEIRDPDTAGLAIQAVRSGHLCVSTLHADGAPLAYDRLSGMGVPRSDIASVGLVAGLIYQRLVPVLCPHCKVPAVDIRTRHGAENDGVLRRLTAYLGGDLQNIYFRNTTGCKECQGRGITTRTVCAEILIPKPAMLHAIAKADSRALWLAWREQIDPARTDLMAGKTAFEHALWKMMQGIVSPVDVEKEFKFLDEPAFE